MTLAFSCLILAKNRKRKTMLGYLFTKEKRTRRSWEKTSTTMMMRWLGGKQGREKRKTFNFTSIVGYFCVWVFRKILHLISLSLSFRPTCSCVLTNSRSTSLTPHTSSPPTFSPCCVLCVCLNVCFFSLIINMDARTDVMWGGCVFLLEGRPVGGGERERESQWLSGEWKILPNYIFQQHKTLVWFFPVYPLNEYMRILY